MLRRLAQATIVTALGTLFVKGAGFGKDLFVARYFGLSAELDLYLLLFSTALLLSAVVAGAVVYTLQPIIAQDRATGELSEAHLLAQQVLTIVIAFLAVVSAVACGLWSVGFRPAFPNIPERVVQILPWCFFPYIILNGAAALLQSVGNSHGQFFRCSVVPAVTPIVTIVLLVLVETPSLWVLTASITIGVFGELLLFALLVRKTGFKPIPRWPRNTSRLRALLASSAFLTIGYIANSLNIVIDQLMAMRFSEGAVATLNYASKLPSLVVGVIGFGAATAFLPAVSTLTAPEHRSHARKIVEQASVALGIVGLICAVALTIPAEYVIRLLFERGEFSAQDTIRVASVLSVYAWLPLATMVGLPANRVLVALGLSRILMFWSICSVGGNVILNLAFGAWLGLPGLALSTVTVATLMSLGLLHVAQRQLRA